MAHKVRKRLRPRVVPKMYLGDPPMATVLLAQIDARIAAAGEAIGARGDISEAAFNRIVEDLNLVRTELVEVGTGAIPARLERQTAEVIAAFDTLASTGRLPSGYAGPGGGGSKTNWLLIGLGVALVGGAWWWAKQEREGALEAALDAMFADGEDCGCDG